MAAGDKVKSGFATLDVTAGRKALRDRVRAGEAVRVRVEMTLTDGFSDDGVSTEFPAVVHSAEEVGRDG